MVAKSQLLDFGGMTLQVKNIVVGFNRPNTIRTTANNSVTQITSRTTGVTANTPSGTITLFSAAGSATPASFTVTNNQVGVNDTIVVNQKSGTDLYEIFVTAVGAGSFRITSFTTGGTTTEQPVFNFNVVKGIA